MALLQAAAREFIPIDPSNKVALGNISASQGKPHIVPEPADRPTIESAMEELRNQEWYVGQIAYDRTVEAKEGQLGMNWNHGRTCRKTNVVPASLCDPLPDAILQGLRDARQITSFYTHQVAAINAFGEGKHVIVSTSTASGKSIIYQVC